MVEADLLHVINDQDECDDDVVIVTCDASNSTTTYSNVSHFFIVSVEFIIINIIFVSFLFLRFVSIKHLL